MKTIISGVCVARPIQITQNNFSISLQYSNKDVSDLQADKHENFQQIDTMIFDGDGPAFAKFPKFPKQEVYNVVTIFQKRRQR